VATNPPYGVRIGERRRLRDLYAQLGNVLRRSCPGWDLVLLSPHTELERQVGFAFRTLAETSNGGLRVRLVSAPVAAAG
jgi:putative N6-adenine-specific DNA methylase